MCLVESDVTIVNCQGIGGQNNLVNFPTLLVRDPAELSPDRTDSKVTKNIFTSLNIFDSCHYYCVM